jgi:hypothetical protein
MYKSRLAPNIITPKKMVRTPFFGERWPRHDRGTPIWTQVPLLHLSSSREHVFLNTHDCIFNLVHQTTRLSMTAGN